MPAIDHLVYAVPDLDRGVAEIAQLTGADAVAGGSHPGAGTRNALLSFDDATYFEIISVDPAQPDPERPRPFGVDPALPSRLAAFAIHPTGDETIEGVAERMMALGLVAGPVTAMSRKRPDGVELHWRLTLNRAVDSSTAAGITPFVIDWGSTETPAKSAPPMGRLVELRLEHDNDRVVAGLTNLGLVVEDGAVMVSRGTPGLTAVVETSSGKHVQLS